jgi:hypothetical protein
MLAVTKVLLDDPLPPLGDIAGPDRSTAKTIADVRRAHTPYWKCFQTGCALVALPPPRPYPAVSQTVSQRRRKRKNSDEEYTPHQRGNNKKPTTSSARRTSKRLAASAAPEKQWSNVTKRSSSSTSVLTSDSSDSSDRLQTPKELDTPDPPAPTSKPKPKKSRPERFPPPEIDWSDADDFSGWDRGCLPSAKIGLPSKEKKIKNEHDYSTSTSYRLIEVGDRFRHIPHL